MSESSSDRVLRAMRAAARRPKPDFATVNELFDPDHEFVPSFAELEGGQYPGAAGFRQFISDMNDTFRQWELTVERVEQVDEGHFLATCFFIGHSRQGGVPIQRPFAQVVTLREGKILRSEAYTSLAQARAAIELGSSIRRP